MSSSAEYWANYLANPQVATSRPDEFTTKVWQGLSDSRVKVWRACIAKHKKKKPLSDAIKPQVLERINLELDQGKLPPKVGNEANKDRVRTLLIAHAKMNDLQHYLQGSVQLALVILSVLKDPEESLQLFQIIIEKMMSYHVDNNVALRTNCLVLADVITRDMPDLAEHFNTLKFDVVDLVDVVVAWSLPLFSCLFLSGVVKRMIDIVLLEGPDYLLGFVYGVFKNFRERLLRVSERTGEQEDEVPVTLFQVISDLPDHLTNQHIALAFRYAYEVYRAPGKQEAIEAMRAEKNWARTMAVPGPVTFVRGVGGPNAVQPPLSVTMPKSTSSSSHRRGQSSMFSLTPSISPTAASSSMPSASSPTSGSSSPIASSPTTRPPSHSVSFAPNSAEQFLQSLDSVDTKDVEAVKRMLDEAKRAVKEQHDKIEQLEMKQLSLGGGRARGYSVASTQEKMAGDAAALAAAEADDDDDSETKASTKTMIGLGTHPSERMNLAKKPPPKSGSIKFSELSEYQDFPCLYMEGYLMKSRQPSRVFKRRNSSGFFGNLHRRWFVLQGHFLTYFKSQTDKKPSKDLCIDMRNRRVIIHRNHEFGPWCIQVNTLGDQCLYLLFASNEAVYETWIRALQESAKPYSSILPPLSSPRTEASS